MVSVLSLVFNDHVRLAPQEPSTIAAWVIPALANSARRKMESFFINYFPKFVSGATFKGLILRLITYKYKESVNVIHAYSLLRGSGKPFSQE